MSGATQDGDRVVASVRGLDVRIGARGGTVHALRGVDLTVHRGEIVAIVGESGSGKSVLASSLLGFRPRATRVDVDGTVDVAGIDMVRGAERDIRRARRHLLGAVFQDPLGSLDPTMRIRRQLRERGISDDAALVDLRRAGVPDAERRLRQWPHELSGGLRQRVMLAMALGADGVVPGAASSDPASSDPASSNGRADHAAATGDTLVDGPPGEPDGAPLLIVADEPTTALDVSVQAQIVSLFDELRREQGCAIVLVTHDLGVAASIADRIVVLYAGRVCEEGPAADVLTRPRHHYTAGLLGARLSVDDDRRARLIGGAPPDPLALPPGCAFAPRCPAAAADCHEAPPELLDGVACAHPRAGADAVTVARPRRPDATAGPDAADETPPVLTVRKVSKSFPVRGTRDRLRAVVDVSLDVAAGGALAVVGESGCGKTTLLRMACGLLEPDHGTVEWADGVRPQLVYQDAASSLTPWRSVGSQVTERLRARGVPRSERADRAAGLLERVGLDRRAARSRARELSGGQRQRAVIARALASDPRLLVCDEPVSALDASLAVRVLDLIDGLRADLGLSVLLVTHDLAAARYLADDVAVMYLGRIVERGPVGTSFDDPVHPYTAGLRAACPTTEPGRLAPTLGGEPPTQIGEAEGCAFAPRCPQALDRCSIEPQSLRPIPDGRLVACEPSFRSRHGRTIAEATPVTVDGARSGGEPSR